MRNKYGQRYSFKDWSYSLSEESQSWSYTSRSAHSKFPLKANTSPSLSHYSRIWWCNQCKRQLPALTKVLFHILFNWCPHRCFVYTGRSHTRTHHCVVSCAKTDVTKCVLWHCVGWPRTFQFLLPSMRWAKGGLEKQNELQGRVCKNAHLHKCLCNPSKVKAYLEGIIIDRSLYCVVTFVSKFCASCSNYNYMTEVTAVVLVRHCLSRDVYYIPRKLWWVQHSWSSGIHIYRAVLTSQFALSMINTMSIISA